LEIQMTTFPSIDLNYRLLSDNTFVVSLNGFVLSTSRTPVLDSALILQRAGVADDTLITLCPEGPEQVGIIYFVSSATSGMVREPN
jgi:hypothetical protein